MQTIPAAVQTLLKSRSMVGANRPAYQVTIGGAPTGVVKELASTTKITQGISSTAKNISNWALKTDGGYMCCWFDQTTKQLQTGFSANTDFLTIDYAIESVTATADIAVGFYDEQQTALYRRSDGKVLLFVTNVVVSGSWVKCYISNSGNGDDWAYYSTVESATTSTLVNTTQSISVPIKTASGRLVLAYTGGKDMFGGIWGIWNIAVSDDNGLTWTIKTSGSYQNSDYSAQPCVLPDGSIFACYTGNNGVSILKKSTDDGNTWADVIDWFAYGARWSFYTEGSTVYAMSCGNDIYYLENATGTNFSTFANWTLLFNTPISTNTLSPRVYLVGDKMAFYSHGDGSDSWILYCNSVTLTLLVKSISIDRSRGSAAAQATIVIDNTGGTYSPDGTGDWSGVLMPNVLVTIEQGYGTDLVQTFVGYIDSVEMSCFPAELRLVCRDKAKLALDRVVTNNSDGGHYVKYTNSTVEATVTALAGLCGLTTGTIEATGMTLTSKLFSWESYADAFDWLADLSSSTWRVDELGVLHFTRDVMPVSPVTAYSFAEGEDIISLGYQISDSDLYYQAVVYGTDSTGAVISATANFGAPLTYGLFSQKVLKVDAPDADTVAKCQEIADRAVALMLCRCRVVDFAAIAVPWLQIGDFIQVVETTSTISELYRVTNISLSQGPDGFTMGITAFWYGEVPN